MKHATIDANDAILTKRAKLQHEKKPVSNLNKISTFSKHI